MGSFGRDLRFALRMLARSPGFATVAILSLTLGIGANTTIFTLAKAIFLHSLPVKNPSTLVRLFSTQESPHGPTLQYLPSSYLNARDIREDNDVFSGLSIVIPSGDQLVISGHETNVFVELVNANYFNILGVKPAAGRFFLPDEDQGDGAHPVAVLSYALWNRKFGANPKVIGSSIQLGEQAFTVIGVAPRSFHDMPGFGSPDVWMPIAMHDEVLTGTEKKWFHMRAARMVGMVARLKPGVTFAQANSSIQALDTHLVEEYPTDNSGRGVEMLPISETTIPPNERSVFVRAGLLLGVIVGLVLLIACANVANLLLARATQREREIAIRLSLGASRWRLTRQLLTESFVLALAAGALGIAFAYGGRNVIVSFLPAGLSRVLNFSLDGRVLLFTVGLAVVATFIFGLAPALRATRTSRMQSLKDRADAPTGGVRWYGLRGILVMVQVTLSLIALVAAGLFIHSLSNAQNINPGFNVHHELLFFLNTRAAHYPQAQAKQFYQQVTERVRALPMVSDAAITDGPPFAGAMELTTFRQGSNYNDPSEGQLTPVIAVQPGYFRTLGITLIRGRGFRESDNSTGAMVAVVNRALADNFWPGQDPIGKHLHFLQETWDVTVVGEVSTVKYRTLGEPPRPIVYWPLKQHFSAFGFLIVHTNGPSSNSLPTIRATIQSVAPTIRLAQVLTVAELLRQSLMPPRIAAELLGAFGLLALVLAAIGTYGVMSYSVSQRTREIGVRMALGAQPADVLRLVLQTGMAMVLVGMAVGLAIATALTRSLDSLLYGIGWFDPLASLVTCALLILVALAACWVPARRAARVDPLVALRYE
jgi:putative ABC transport system permease protein